MADETGGQQTQEQTAAPIDTTRLELILDRLRADQNLVAGVLAGGLGAVVGAGLWAAVTVFTGYQIGWMAVGIGFLVGYLVRLAGKGIDKSFGVAGALLSLLGCALGNLLTVCGMLARQEGVPFLEVMSNLDAGAVGQLMVHTFSPMDLVFYGIAGYEGYKLSIRKLTEIELAELNG